MFKKLKNIKLKKSLSTVALVCFLLVVLIFICWMNLLSYITAGNLMKTKIYIFIYLLWNTNLLSSFSSLFFYATTNYAMFFSGSTIFLFYFLFFKPKLFYQYFFKSLRKQQLRVILLNIYIFNLINFTKLCSLLATFFNTQETFQRCLNIAMVILRRDVGHCQINVETTLCMSALKFITSNNVKSTLSISMLIWNVETMLLFLTLSFTTLINVKTRLWIWPFSKS